jgi:hypothetical protein
MLECTFTHSLCRCPRTGSYPGDFNKKEKSDLCIRKPCSATCLDDRHLLSPPVSYFQFITPKRYSTWNVFSSMSVSSVLSTIFSSRFLFLMVHSFRPNRSAPEITTMMSRDTEIRGRFDGDKGLSRSMRHSRHILVDFPPSL